MRFAAASFLPLSVTMALATLAPGAGAATSPVHCEAGTTPSSAPGGDGLVEHFCANPKGIKQGPAVVVDAEGHERQELTYEAGRRHGRFVAWAPPVGSGEPVVVEEGVYTYGRKVGVWRRFWPDGTRREETTWEVAYQRYEGDHWRGPKGPYRRFHPSGELAEEGTWAPARARYDLATGTFRAPRLPPERSVKVGEWRTFRADGTPAAVETWADVPTIGEGSVKLGAQVTFDASGDVRTSELWVPDGPNGTVAARRCDLSGPEPTGDGCVPVLAAAGTEKRRQRILSWAQRHPTGRSLPDAARARLVEAIGSSARTGLTVADELAAVRAARRPLPCPPLLNWSETKHPNGRVATRGCARPGDGKLIGRSKGFWPDGKPRLEATVGDHVGQPLFEGAFRVWHANGHLEALGHFSEGCQVGLLTVWRADGHKVYEGRYVDNEKCGVHRRWEGKRMVADKHGSCADLRPRPERPAEGVEVLTKVVATATSEGGRRASARRAIDGKTTTWWSEGLDDDGLGESLTLKLPATATVTRLRVVPGLLGTGRASEGESWTRYNRVKRLLVTTSSGWTTTALLPDQPGFQDVPIGGQATDWVRLTLLEVHHGVTARGDKSFDTGIAEVELLGREGGRVPTLGTSYPEPDGTPQVTLEAPEPGRPVELQWFGLPAVSADGERVAIPISEPGPASDTLRIVIRRRKDDAKVRELDVLRLEEAIPGWRKRHGDEVRQRVAAASKVLKEGGFQALAGLEIPGVRPRDRRVAHGAGGVVIFGEPRLMVLNAKGEGVVKRSVPTWSAPPNPRDELCTNPAWLQGAWSSPSTLVLVIGYEGDPSCPAPAPQGHVVTLPKLD